ncbi:MAG: LptE family protein [Bacteroidota bacterium]
MIKFRNIYFLLILFLLNGCGMYSFTGANISADTKTISIQYFPNNAPLRQPTLSQVLTQSLRDRFSSQTNLMQVSSNGDLSLEGEITGYSVSPTAIQANQTAAQNRLTITVKVKFVNTKDDKQSFETGFSRYVDYDSQKNLQAVEGDLIKTLSDQLVEDIFNKAVVNW